MYAKFILHKYCDKKKIFYQVRSKNGKKYTYDLIRNIYMTYIQKNM